MQARDSRLSAQQGLWPIPANCRGSISVVVWVISVLLLVCQYARADDTQKKPVPVVNGVVQPCRPIPEAIAQAMSFLKKADGGYVPGRTDGELAGYFTSAHVNPDGTRSNRRLSFPARQHAYFISTFLMYYAYSGEREWLLRARDLGEWNLEHSTPANAAYPDLPYSTFSNGKPGGSRDKDSTEPDKAAFFGSAYIALFQATAEAKYLEAARKVAATLVRTQREDGSWPFRVVPETGDVRQDFGGAPVFFVEFFEKLAPYDETAANRRAVAKARELMVQRIRKNLWGTYHEDIVLKPEDYLSAEPMSFTASYLFRETRRHPEYLDLGRAVIRSMEDRLVYTNGHAAAPAPAVSEQAGFEHLMPGHTARYCRALADLYALTGDQQVKRRALSGFNAVTYMQSAPGLFRTFFASVNPKANTQNRPDWYSQHLYTVCHLLESMYALPELAPAAEDHVIGSDVFVREVRYRPGAVTFQADAPSRTFLKLSYTPKTVSVGQRELPPAGTLSDEAGWSFDRATSVLTIRHGPGLVEIRK